MLPRPVDVLSRVRLFQYPTSALATPSAHLQLAHAQTLTPAAADPALTSALNS